MSHEVFISHSARDKPIADAMCQALESRGIPCWIAPRNILPGVEWGDAIIEAIRECKVMVVVFSSHANASAQVKREVNCAIEENRAVLPVRVEPIHPDGAMKYLLSTTHWLDALTPPFQQHIEPLVKTVMRLLNPETPEHPPLSAPMPLPAGYAQGGLHGIGPVDQTLPRRRRAVWPWIAGLLTLLLVAGTVTVILLLWPEPVKPVEDTPADPFVAQDPFPFIMDVPIVKPSFGTGRDGQSRALAWAMYEDEKGLFRAEFPGPVLKDSRNVNTAVGKIVMYMFGTELNGGAYVVMYGDYPGVLPEENVQQMLDSGVEGMVANVGGTLRASVDYDLQGYPGRDVSVEIPANGMMVKVRMCLVNGSRMYIWMVVTSRERILAPEVVRFMDSFHITGTPPKPNNEVVPRLPTPRTPTIR